VSGDAPVVLVGLMGSGKSTVASAFATATNYVAVDLDDVVATTAGMDVRAIFEAHGETAFRRFEFEALCRVLDGALPCVVACGGGVVATPLGRARLRAEDRVVFLDVSIDEAAARLEGDHEGRPLLDGDVRQCLDALATERRAWYLDVADVVIGVDDKSVEELVAEITNWLGDHS
jgi:shikimate kinase